jgi:hypothetical protein
MEFFSANSNYPTQVKALVEHRPCLPFGTFVGFFLAYEHLNLMSQETADGS